jgi:tetratricopeptide (TPR) repeat protein
LTQQFKLSVETAKRLGAKHELALAREAWRRNPESRLMRSRLVHLLSLSDSHEDVIEVVAQAGDASFGESITMLFAYLSLESDEGNRTAAQLATELAEQADSNPARAAALAVLGKAQARLGLDAAEATLRQALAADPHNKDACKRLAAILLARSDPQAVLQLTASLLEQGAAHSRLFAARVLALALTGQTKEARALEGIAQLGKRTMLPLPDGFASLDEFNRALAAQLVSHPELRFDRYGTASELTWRIDAPQSAHAPLVDVLLQGLSRIVSDHVDSLAGIDHPWLRTRPDAGKLHCWSVITDDVGYETWHVHQFGWMSGTYYVQVPDAIANGNGEGGCLAFGLPEELVGETASAEFGRDYLRPRAGMLSLFPSHCYHRTFPHNLSERRICIAFDIWPD